MTAREEIEKLKREFVSLNTEEERKAFDAKFYGHLNAKNDDEKRKFADAFADAAKTDVKRIKNFCDEVTIRTKLEEILDLISVSYISQKYFHKSKSWFSQKLNGNLKHGIPSEFTKNELQILSFALEDMGDRIKNTARSIA